MVQGVQAQQVALDLQVEQEQLEVLVLPEEQVPQEVLEALEVLESLGEVGLQEELDQQVNLSNLYRTHPILWPSLMLIML